MSAAFTLHLDRFARPGDPEALERADLVRDGFSWGAFLVPMLWFFRHRHLWLGLGALAVVVGLAAALWLAGARLGTIVAAELLLHLLFGFEGASLRRWALTRRGRPETDIVLAPDAVEAEVKAFSRWLEPTNTVPNRLEGQAGPGLAWTGSWNEPEPVIGLFPDQEGRRR